MLVGRADEAAFLEGLLDRARDEASSALIVHGDPGVGKTALLESVLRDADHMTVVRTRPIETESELPFAGLSDLLRPFLPLLDRIPERQAAVLSGALALGPPAPGDRFAAAAATLSLLAAAAEDGPLLAVVDDSHWLDVTSRETLLFAGRRLGSEGIVLLLAMRYRTWIDTAGIDRFELKGLAPDAAASLVEGAGKRIAPHVRDRITRETEGNPLAILEAVATLPDEQLDGSEPIEGPIPVGATLERALAQRLDLMPEPTRRALLVVAVSDSGDAEEIDRALSGSGLGPEALAPAEDEGIITRDHGGIEFRHPLVRSAAYQMHTAPQRRTAHRALAEALDPSRSDRVAWHLAQASAGPDERVASMLEESAGRAQAQGGYAAAGRAFESAARLSVHDNDKLRRTMGAGLALFFGGEPQRASALLESVLPLAVEPTARADLQELRAVASLFIRPVSETYEMLLAEADRVAPHDPDRAAGLLSNAALTRFMAADQGTAGETARLALRMPRGEAGASSLRARNVVAMVQAVNGEVDKALATLEPVLPHLEIVDPLGESPLALLAVPQTLRWLERVDRARAFLDRVIGAARAAGAPSVLPFGLAILADFELDLGRIAGAYVAATESVQLAAETGQTGESAYSLVVLARVEAILGHDVDCRTHVAAGLDTCRRTGASTIELFGAAALGLLELSRGRADRAVIHLAECQRREEQFDLRLPTVLHYAGDHIEACIRSGAIEDAERRLAVLEGQASKTRLRWPAAVAARCRGLLADDTHYEREFETALDLHGADMRFEHARTLLCLGMRRRRSRRRSDARAALHDALAFFEASGAEPWAEQVRAELRAAGDPPLPSADQSLRSLTPQELQVALIVAGGATNKEAAASLFLSPKTVEFHLGNVYRKLGLRSRTELVRRVASSS